MNVFISWSGPRSQALAVALRDWLPMLFQSIEPWVSSADILAGARWAAELTEKLENADFGILCVTRENLTAPWLVFEAGALFRTLPHGQVVPYLLGVTEKDLPGPLSQFQAVNADEAGTRLLAEALASCNPANLRTDTSLQKVFEMTWPLLLKQLAGIRDIVDVATSNEEESQPSKIHEAKVSEREQYLRSIEGSYEHYTVQDVPSGGLTHITYKGRNTLLTEGEAGDGQWTGRIEMSDTIPELGKGAYQYRGKRDCGLHEIQVNREDGSIYVLVKNTSHGKDFTHAYLWKPSGKA